MMRELQAHPAPPSFHQLAQVHPIQALTFIVLLVSVKVPIYSINTIHPHPHPHQEACHDDTNTQLSQFTQSKLNVVLFNVKFQIICK